MLSIDFITTLQQCCNVGTNKLFKGVTKLGFTTYKRNKRRFAFRPGLTETSPMIVCHADTVVKGGEGPHNWDYNAQLHLVTSIALDDRLGIACMVDAIKSQSALSDCAMLICDEEEIGNSTAQLFDLDVQPNWMVELDRRGDDVVCYEYESALFTALLEQSGFRVGHGTFSDISYLGSMGVVGFNMGVGYHREHSQNCHADLRDTSAQLSRLLNFYNRFESIRLPYSPRPRYSKWDKRGWALDYVDDNDDYFNNADYMDVDDHWIDDDKLGVRVTDKPLN